MCGERLIGGSSLTTTGKRENDGTQRKKKANFKRGGIIQKNGRSPKKKGGIEKGVEHEPGGMQDGNVGTGGHNKKKKLSNLGKKKNRLSPHQGGPESQKKPDLSCKGVCGSEGRIPRGKHQKKNPKNCPVKKKRVETVLKKGKLGSYSVVSGRISVKQEITVRKASRKGNVGPAPEKNGRTAVGSPPAGQPFPTDRPLIMREGGTTIGSRKETDPKQEKTVHHRRPRRWKTKDLCQVQPNWESHNVPT